MRHGSSAVRILRRWSTIAVIVLVGIGFAPVSVAGPFLVIVGALLAACLIGLVNGVLGTSGRVSGIAVTLCMMFVLDGLNQFVTNGDQIAVDYKEEAFRWLGQGRTGHYTSAVGDNAMAAYQSGIPVYRWVIASFILAALMSGMGGVLLTSISSSAQPVGGQGCLLEAFAAVYLGATILGKRKPHVFQPGILPALINGSFNAKRL